ncbi:MAG: hypothetical protein IPJ31_15225 [Bacteroidetes bacterium]|nr:hypothetical protein [Bacteroidota bacterium]
MRKIVVALLVAASNLVMAQGGNLSGDLMMNVNFFQRDTNIKAAGNPLYDNYLSGGEGWLSLRYSVKGFTAAVRFDGFHNSNLQNPISALSASGLGTFSLSKEVQNLTITAGHVYDQIGSGIIFRAYEDRGLLIDNALFGLHLKYRAGKYATLKGFTGQTKNLFDRYKPIIKGFSAEGEFDLGSKAHTTPGIGIVNRTMDQASINYVVSEINNYPLAERYKPTYNNFAMTFYNTLNFGDFSWYVEAATKSKEATHYANVLKNLGGTVLYSTLGYAQAKWGLNASIKRSENFELRSSPKEILLQGIYNWQPIIAQIRPQRLIARYTPPSQFSELGGSLSGMLTPNENMTFNVAYTKINSLDTGATLFREVYADGEIRSVKDFIIRFGAQYLLYNQFIYQQKVNKSEYPDVNAITPFLELIYKINNKKSLRTELQYMSTKQDYGSWVFGLLEFSIAPKWSFAISDMYNIAPNKVHVKKALHYPNLFIARVAGPHRFTLQYVKQVDGINCTGGVCRYEPAFSGFKLGITSTF